MSEIACIALEVFIYAAGFGLFIGFCYVVALISCWIGPGRNWGG